MKSLIAAAVLALVASMVITLPVHPTAAAPGQPLDHGGRLDGGGRADPVAQAVATSQSLFADGAADRVVLATADRFPDALAGAALAGDRGPILLTPFAEALDPRVAAEVARVTGGGGVVLTLGGNAAVTDSAAAQARLAAGDRPCAAPLPSGCRYDGFGREATAAAIAATVMAEHPGDQVLLARGDDFADAITGGAYAAAAGVPILLTPSTMLSEPTRSFLVDNAVAEVVVLGGVVAVDQPTVDSLPADSVRRVEGEERTATAAAIATQLWQPSGLAGGGVVLVNVRDADGWQTALSAAVASAVHGAPQLGVEPPPAPPSQTTITTAAAVEGPVQAFGGVDLVSEEQLAAVAGSPVPPPAPGDPTGGLYLTARYTDGLSRYDVTTGDLVQVVPDAVTPSVDGRTYLRYEFEFEPVRGYAVSIHDMATRAELQSFHFDLVDNVNTMRPHPDGDLIVVNLQDGRGMAVIDQDSEEVLGLRNAEGTWSPDGDLYIAASDEETSTHAIYLLPLDDGELTGDTYELATWTSAPEVPIDLAVSADGSRLAYSRLGDIHVRDLDVDAGTVGPEHRVAGGVLELARPTWSPDASQLALAEWSSCGSYCDGGPVFIVPADGRDLQVEDGDQHDIGVGLVRLGSDHSVMSWVEDISPR